MSFWWWSQPGIHVCEVEAQLQRHSVCSGTWDSQSAVTSCSSPRLADACTLLGAVCPFWLRVPDYTTPQAHLELLIGGFLCGRACSVCFHAAACMLTWRLFTFYIVLPVCWDPDRDACVLCGACRIIAGLAVEVGGAVRAALGGSVLGCLLVGTSARQRVVVGLALRTH